MCILSLTVSFVRVRERAHTHICSDFQSHFQRHIHQFETVHWNNLFLFFTKKMNNNEKIVHNSTLKFRLVRACLCFGMYPFLINLLLFSCCYATFFSFVTPFLALALYLCIQIIPWNRILILLSIVQRWTTVCELVCVSVSVSLSELLSFEYRVEEKCASKRPFTFHHERTKLKMTF